MIKKTFNKKTPLECEESILLLFIEYLIVVFSVKKPFLYKKNVVTLYFIFTMNVLT